MPARCSVPLNFSLAGCTGVGQILGTPEKLSRAVFLGHPRGPHQRCSVPQNFSLAALAGASRIFSPPKSHPRLFVGKWLPMLRWQPGGVRCCKESRRSSHGESKVLKRKTDG